MGVVAFMQYISGIGWGSDNGNTNKLFCKCFLL